MTHATALTREACQALDAQDALAPLRQQFSLPEGLIYLDGNSLGVLPRQTAQRVTEVVEQEWGQGLIRSWNSAGWIDLPRKVGDKIARLLGAPAGEVVVADSTSVNLYKVLSAALRIAQSDVPTRRVILSERSNFPTDLYMAQSLAEQFGMQLKLTTAEALDQDLNDQVAVLMLTHVNYRSGRMFDMAAVTAQAHACGALTVWDLAHSAGAVPVDLHAAQADFAIGCGYKYLNGGPGAPAFVWAHPRHANRFWQPLSGWMGHAAPFVFDTAYQPAAGIGRYLCGTPAVLAMSALECGVDTLLAAEPLGGMAALRRKSLALTQLFMDQVQQRLGQHGLRTHTPAEAQQRGSQVSLTVPVGISAYGVMQALIERGVVGDFRAGDGSPQEPDLLRFGFTPLYVRHVDVYDAVSALDAVLSSGQWREARFNQRAAVT